MSLTKSLVERALTTVDGPDGLDLVTSGALRWVSACDGYASVKIFLPDTDETAMRSIATQAEAAVRKEAAASGSAFSAFNARFVNHGGDVVFTAGGGPADPEAAQAEAKPAGRAVGGQNPQETAEALPGVQNIIAVGAGKGGVGKSTVSVNLAVALARQGHAVGLLDGDIYGPSLPTMLGLGALEQVVLDGKLHPFNVHGIKAVTIGKLVDAEKPLIWRGPMAHGAFNQLTTRTSWGELDYLIVDLPPGTGDVPLTLAQSLSLTGAVVVCTPQRVAQDDATRAVRMFQQLGVEVLGVVENMSYFVGDDGKTYDIFGRGGAEMMAQRMGLPYLGGVPITMSLRANSDNGDPSANFSGEDDAGVRLKKALEDLGRTLESQVSLASLKQGKKKPTLTIS